MAFRLTRDARQDLFEIYEYGVREYGQARAVDYFNRLVDQFEALAIHPFRAPERHEIEPKVRMHRMGSHLISYVVEDGDVVVLNIFHARSDWRGDAN